MKTTIATLMFAVLGSIASHAASTINYEFGALTAKTGGAALSDGSLVYLYVSTTGEAIDGAALQTALVGQTLAVGSTFGGSNIIIGASRVNSTSFSQAGTGNDTATDVLYSNGISQGDAIGLIWFEQSASTGITAGVDFGFFTSAVTMPADPSNVDIAISSVSFGGSIADSSMRSAFTTVPEPSAALLGALGAFGLLRRRRN